MKTLVEIVEESVRDSMGWSKEDLDNFIHQDRTCLHDPFLYHGMDKLVTRLHEYKQYQETHPESILIVDTDYDTDGIKSTAVVSASLSVFNINHRVYTPSMADGYGLSVKAVNDMLEDYKNHKIDMILTADNGTNAADGIDYANEKGITVLVTDHHLGSGKIADAYVIVNPNQPLEGGEPYPFKGNAGAAVAWKTMLAYAQKYEPDKYELIYDLIVFAGIANVADVMPIVDENHFIVKEAVKELQRLIQIRQTYGTGIKAYPYVKDTPYAGYNNVFHGLFDLLNLLQESKDEPRRSKGLDTYLLPTDEELISWYISPLMNAPRRIHATCKEAIYAILYPESNIRQQNIEQILFFNKEKSRLRDLVLDKITEECYGENSNVLFVNTVHGISGLIAGKILEATGNATIVFAKPSDTEDIIYDSHTFEDDILIGASARSTELQPLNVIISEINKIDPDIIIGGGGHAEAAGYTIKYKKLDTFITLFDKIAKMIREDIEAQQKELHDQGIIDSRPSNEVTISLINSDEYKPTRSFSKELLDTIAFMQTLKPFGKDFYGETKLYLEFIPSQLVNDDYKLDLQFWNGQSLRFDIESVKVLTWDKELASVLKALIINKSDEPIKIPVTLKINTYNGHTNPQLIMKTN